MSERERVTPPSEREQTSEDEVEGHRFVTQQSEQKSDDEEPDVEGHRFVT